MSRVREKLDLQSGRGRVVDIEEQTPHHQMPNGGHPLGALGAPPASSAKHGGGISGNARREACQQGAGLGIARAFNQVPPLRNAQLARCSSSCSSVKEPCRWVRRTSQISRWRAGAHGRLLESGSASCTARRLGRAAPMRRSLLRRGPATW